MNILRRTGLLEQITTSAGHVMLSAPSGYGKTVLLEQLLPLLPGAVLIVATPCDTVATLMERANTAVPNHQACLIDDAAVLPPEEIAALLRIPPTLRRIILAVHHVQYARVQLLLQKRQLLILDAAALALPFDDLSNIYGQTNVQDIWDQTLGWPALVNSRHRTYGDVSSYLNDLLIDVNEEVQEYLTEIASQSRWDAFVMILEREGQLTSLLNCGFPLIPIHGQFKVHPAMRRHLQERAGLNQETIDQQESDLKDLLGLKNRLSSGEMATLIDSFFKRYGEDDSEVSNKIHLLSSVPLQRISPELRDIYANYLITAGKHREAEYVLIKQQESKTDSSRTYILLGRLAAWSNKIDVWGQMLELARERASTDADCSRYYAYLSNYYIRCNNYEEAEQAARKNLEYALRSRDLGLHFSALSNISYARQMKGNVLGAKDAAIEGLELAEREGAKYFPQAAYLSFQLSEVLKDTGKFDEALDLIQRCLSTQTLNFAASPYLYNTRGLIYLEFGRLDEAMMSFSAAIDGFHARSNVVGLLMPHTFAAYTLYRLGWFDRLDEHWIALRDVVSRITATSEEYTEHHAYFPLVDGLIRLAKDDMDGALQALESIALDGRMTYDSVLLATLLAGQVRLARNAYTREQAQLLVEILDARGSTTDVTARMYRKDFAAVYQACIALGIEPARFRRILEIPDPQLSARPAYPIHLLTLGRVGLVAAGHEQAVNMAYAPYALIYLYLKKDWKTADSLGADLFTLTSDPRRNAQKAISGLRTVLRNLDAELERTLLAPKHDPRGYRVEANDQVHLSADVDPYLSARYTPDNADLVDLEHLLARVAVFLPGLPDSAYAREINRLLEDRTIQVASALAHTYQQRGDISAAARIVLLGLRFVPAPELGALLRRLLPNLQTSARSPVRSVLRLVEHDGDQNLGDQITDALGAI